MRSCWSPKKVDNQEKWCGSSCIFAGDAYCSDAEEHPDFVRQEIERLRGKLKKLKEARSGK